MNALLTAEEVAALIGMTTDWVYAETRAGRIPHVKLAFFVAGLCLVAAPGAHAAFPGPDGAIAFHTPFDPNAGNGGISAMRPDGSDIRAVTRTPRRNESSPDWSPDGSTGLQLPRPGLESPGDRNHRALRRSCDRRDQQASRPGFRW